MQCDPIDERDAAGQPDRHVHSYKPSAGHGLAYDPLKAIVAPRPIAWISTIDGTGVCNLAPYSYFNLFSNDPPILGFGSQGRKDSLRNIEAMGEFVVNLATLELAAAMNISSLPVDADVDEFALARLGKLPSRQVRPPRVAGSPASLECKLTGLMPLTGLDGRAGEAVLVLGEIVQVHIETAYIVDGRFETARASPLARCGYLSDYMVGDSIYRLDRPEMPEADVVTAARGRRSD